jgi:HK97 family phage major capsid protein/HK97 family phage prohead protease
MPMPTPGANETQDDFMSRCIPMVMGDGGASNHDQAIAMCNSMWENKSIGMTRRAYSTFEIKSIDKKQRIIEGVASTPSVDRVGDIVEPMGAKFSLPMPFLWQHDSNQPIGHVVDAKTTKDGIHFKAQMVNVAEPGRLKDRTDEAWQSLDYGLVRGVSIGFKGIDVEPIDKKDPFGGQRFKEFSLIEISAVTIPANMEASITNIRSIDQGKVVSDKAASIVPAVSGQKAKSSAVAGRSLEMKRPKMAKLTNTERIKGLEEKRAAEVAAREAIQEKVTDENRTKDDAEQNEFDERSATIKAIDRELADCRVIEKELIATAKPVLPTNGHDPHSLEVRNPSTIEVMPPKLPLGIGLMKALHCAAFARENNRDVLAVAREHCAQWPQVENYLRYKANVAVGTTTGTTWAAPLVYPANLASEFLEFLVPQTFFGRIPGLTKVPFNVRVPRETSVITAAWVGEARSKPAQAIAYDSVSLAYHKTAVIVGVTQELARFSSPAVEELARANLAKGIAKFIDTQFVTASVTAVPGVNPAAITNGADTDTASGTDITAVIHDIREILFHFQEYNIPTDNVVLLMQPVLATSIGTMMTTLGVRQFPDINGQGGSILGVQVITSNNVPNGYIVALHPPSVFVADDGAITIDVSTEASIEMVDNPTSTDYHLVSAFQMNLMFIRAERFVTWVRGRDKGVYYLTGCQYAGAVTG